MTVHRPESIIEEFSAPLTYQQLAVLTTDGSGSMSASIAETGRTKGQEVIHHLLSPTNGLLARLRASRTRDAFYVALVTFDDRVDVALHPTPVTQVADDDFDIDLLVKHGQSTAIGKALREAVALGRAWIAQADPDIPRVVTICLLSDGQETAGSDPLGEAQAVKSGPPEPRLGRPAITIASCAYGDDADEATLRSIASTGPDGSPLFLRSDSGERIRDFFLRSITSAVGGAP